MVGQSNAVPCCSTRYRKERRGWLAPPRKMNRTNEKSSSSLLRLCLLLTSNDISSAGERRQPRPCEASEETPAPWLLAWYACGGFTNSSSSAFPQTMEAIQKVGACVEPATAAAATAAGRSMSGEGSTPSPEGGSKLSPASLVQGSPMGKASLTGDGLSASPCGGGPVEVALRAAGGVAQVRDGETPQIQYVFCRVVCHDMYFVITYSTDLLKHETRILAQARLIGFLVVKSAFHTKISHIFL